MINGAESLECSSMSKHLPSIHVANGINVWHICLHVFIYGDSFPVVFYAYRIEIQSINIRASSRCNEYGICFYKRFLSLAIEYDLLFINFLHSWLQIELDSTFLQTLAQSFGNVTIHIGKTFFHEFNHHNLTTKAIENGSEFHSYHSCTNNTKFLRNMINVEQFRGCEHMRLVNTFDGRWHNSMRTSCYDDVFRLIFFLIHHTGICIFERSLSTNKWDVRLGKQRFHTIP